MSLSQYSQLRVSYGESLGNSDIPVLRLEQVGGQKERQGRPAVRERLVRSAVPGVVGRSPLALRLVEIAMISFNNSFSNRCFAAFLSILLMIPTGWGLFSFWTHDSSTDNQDWLSRAFVYAAMDAVAVAFVFSVLGLIWAAFRPRWIDRLFCFTQEHFIQVLAALLCVVLAMLAFSFITIYGG
jgi:hypothetical protein